MSDKHPMWDGASVQDEGDPTNKLAIAVMEAFYLGRGFMECPMWEEESEDLRYGWRSIARFILRRDAPSPTPSEDTSPGMRETPETKDG